MENLRYRYTAIRGSKGLAGNNGIKERGGLGNIVEFHAPWKSSRRTRSVAISSSEIVRPNGEVLVSRNDGTRSLFVVLEAARSVMLTRVPRACPWWYVADHDREPCLISQMRSFPFPQPDA